MFEEILKGIRGTIAAETEARQAARSVIETIQAACLAEKRDPSDEEVAKVTSAQADVDARDANLKAAKDRLAEIEEAHRGDLAAKQFLADHKIDASDGHEERGSITTKPPATYRRNGERSFFRDLWSAGRGDFMAREAIVRHSREAADQMNLSERAQSTGGNGANGSIVIPQWLLDLWAPLLRAQRVTANIVSHAELPPTGMSFPIPTGVVGSKVGPQAAENTLVANQDMTYGTVTVPVVSVGGYQDVSLQFLQRAEVNTDQLIFQDLAADYMRELNRQVLNGSGASGEALGILRTSVIPTMTAFSAAVTPALLWSKVAGAINSVQTLGYTAPDAIIMHPSRWNWAVSQLDTAGRPLVVPSAQASFNALGLSGPIGDASSVTPVGTFQGVPVVLDPLIPTAVGTGPEDQIIVLNRSQPILWEENGGAPTQVRFDETLGGQMTSRLVCYGFAAFTAARYPQRAAIIGGNAAAGKGLIAPTF